MPALNLSITIAEEDMPRVIAAARGVFGDDKTADDIVEAIRQHGIGLIRELVRNHERRLAIAAAEALDPQVQVS